MRRVRTSRRRHGRNTRKDDVCQPGLFKMVDHTRNDAYTTLRQDLTGLNEGLRRTFHAACPSAGW